MNVRPAPSVSAAALRAPIHPKDAEELVPSYLRRRPRPDIDRNLERLAFALLFGGDDGDGRFGSVLVPGRVRR